MGGRDLGDVHRRDDGSETDREAADNTPGHEVVDREGEGGAKPGNQEENGGDEHHALATVLLGQAAPDERTDSRSQQGDGDDESLEEPVGDVELRVDRLIGAVNDAAVVAEEEPAERGNDGQHGHLADMHQLGGSALVGGGGDVHGRQVQRTRAPLRGA